MKLEPKYYVLEELLERRLFRIPEYQRAYSWETKQRQDLFEDVRTPQTRGRDTCCARLEQENN